jgi:hypothetical protein
VCNQPPDDLCGVDTVKSYPAVSIYLLLLPYFIFLLAAYGESLYSKSIFYSVLTSAVATRQSMMAYLGKHAVVFYMAQLAQLTLLALPD